MTRKIKKKKEITVGDLAVKVDGLATSINELTVMTAGGFNDVQEQIKEIKTNQLFFKEDFSDIKSNVKIIANDLKRVRETLEKNTTSLKRLDEERIFTLSYAKRLEHEIEKIKAHLKIA